jgi:hypothetical protein
MINKKEEIISTGNRRERNPLTAHILLIPFLKDPKIDPDNH